MELACAHQSMYLPPILVGFLFFYRMMFGGVMTDHPIVKQFSVVTSSAGLLSDTLVQTLTTLVNATQTNAVVVSQLSLSLLHRLGHTLSMVVVNIQRMMTTIYPSLALTKHLASLRIQFGTVAQQTYASTSTLLGTLQSFFVPPQPTMYERAYVGLLVGSSLLVVALTLYSLTDRRTKTLESSHTHVDHQEKTPPLRRNPVRRKTKVT